MEGEILTRVWKSLSERDRKEYLIAKWFSILLLSVMFLAIILSQPSVGLKLFVLIITSLLMVLFIFSVKEKKIRTRG